MIIVDVIGPNSDARDRHFTGWNNVQDTFGLLSAVIGNDLGLSGSSTLNHRAAHHSRYRGISDAQSHAVCGREDHAVTTADGRNLVRELLAGLIV